MHCGVGTLAVMSMLGPAAHVPLPDARDPATDATVLAAATTAATTTATPSVDEIVERDEATDATVLAASTTAATTAATPSVDDSTTATVPSAKTTPAPDETVELRKDSKAESKADATDAADAIEVPAALDTGAAAEPGMTVTFETGFDTDASTEKDELKKKKKKTKKKKTPGATVLTWASKYKSKEVLPTVIEVSPPCHHTPLRPPIGPPPDPPQHTHTHQQPTSNTIGKGEKAEGKVAFWLTISGHLHCYLLCSGRPLPTSRMPRLSAG